MKSSIRIKFNGGNALLLWDGGGSATLSSLGLCFCDEAGRLRDVHATLKLVEAAWKSLGYCECAKCTKARAALAAAKGTP